MKLAINQPYFFPYLGYFQLLNQVNAFIFLDDVNYIKRGWINHNVIANPHGEELPFSVPLTKPSQNRHINQTLLSPTYPDWRAKWLLTLHHCYAQALNYSVVMPLLQEVVHGPNLVTIADLAERSIVETCKFLGVTNAFARSSEVPKTCGGEERIIELCKNSSTTHYYNLSGGMSLYHAEVFRRHGIELLFVKGTASLSIIDLLMRVPLDEVKQMLTQVQILKG